MPATSIKDPLSRAENRPKTAFFGRNFQKFGPESDIPEPET